MTDAETQSKLAECQDMIRLLTAKLTEVAAERDRLRAEKSDALSVCQEMYNNPDVPPALRLKAAGLALQFEVPKLMPERAPINATCEEYIPLAELIAQRRARCDQLLREQQEIRVLPGGQVVVLDEGVGGDGSGE